MTLKEVLKYKNVAGEPYFGDIMRWLGITWNDIHTKFEGRYKFLDELQDALKEMQEK